MELSGALFSGLIDHISNSWDQDILSDIFIPENVTRISRIPVSPDYEDSWYWLSDPKGCYSVKSGYRHIVGTFECNSDNFDKWVALWSLKVPPKWRTFLWRALSDILPTTTNLLLKRVEVNSLCPMCGLDHENVMHALVLCDYARLVWHKSSLPITNIDGDTFAMWLKNVMLSMRGTNWTGSCCLCNFWHSRNRVVWEHSLPRPRNTWSAAVSLLHAYRQVHLRPPPPPADIVEPVAPPPRLRCFFDAGYKPLTGEATFGAVLLSHNGTFVAACNGKLVSYF
ncbi:PREDICTED: uncharacterized protein LOC109181309 [Ipomoea nil]|uniref:uncharacterized protein LOC109181309 n=1 Tax=Ipomoea nil TaxID=35883 RepID=UPI0009015F54|nr:PREDICTED: uncharacterized protein LOC109181309 [Ipomoea nil]